MATEPTIEQCIAQHERCLKHERHMEQSTTLGRVQAAYHAENAEYEEATLAFLRDHARLKAEAADMRGKLDDPNIVRLPKHSPSFSWSEAWPYFVEDAEALAMVAAWDKERIKAAAPKEPTE